MEAWTYASRPPPSPFPTFSPVWSFAPPPPPPPADGVGDELGDAGEELAQWMVNSLVLEEEEEAVADAAKPAALPGLGQSPPSPCSLTAAALAGSLPRVRTATGCSTPSTTWSNGGTSEDYPSENGSPTSVLRNAESSAWDLLFSAAGEVQRLARQKECQMAAQNGGARSLDELVRDLRANDVSIPSANVGVTPSPCHCKCGGYGRCCGYGGYGGYGGFPGDAGEFESFAYSGRRDEDRRRGGWKGNWQGKKATEQVPKCGGGTGVFLPRPMTSALLEVRGKKSQKATTVLLPPHLVALLGLKVDGNNKVVLEGTREHSGGGRKKAWRRKDKELR